MMISRDPEAAGKQNYDAVIIGGGIYGITLALEAGRKGLKTLLVEQGDFGEQTSFNSLKIIHGGLRYLQSLDLHRFRESVGERTWFLRHFPERVHPLPCFMPLYGKGMRRPSIFRGALLANHLLSLGRNTGVDPDHHLPMGKVVGVEQSRAIFPLLDTRGLKGGAVWYDAYMPDSQLLVMDLLQAACSLGAVSLNYVRATGLLTDSQGHIRGVEALDRASTTPCAFHADLVINAAGPWCRQVVEGITGDRKELFQPSLAWNVLFKRKALSDHALAVQAREPGSRLYFITPWKDKIFAGTGHEPWLAGPGRPMPTFRQLSSFIGSLNKAVTGLNLQLEDVDRIFAGLLPTTEAGSNVLTKRECIVDHGAAGGPTGLYSVGGIKFTTARLVAEKILELAGQGTTEPVAIAGVTSSYPAMDELEQYRELLARDASIVHLDDLVFRRSTLWESSSEFEEMAESLCSLFPWDEARKEQELAKCRACLESLPQK
jgi:glycerol-3-phosphate dehydrogenase